MLAAVLGGSITSPSHWHKKFQVGLGLDLSWGTQITLRAYRPNSHAAVDQGAMSKARQIMLDRISSNGFNDASVVQQGTNEIVVSVPHENAQTVANLVGTTATLSFRQLLLQAPNTVTGTTPTPSTTPSASPSPSTSPSSSPKTSSSPKASASPTVSSSTSPKAKASAAGTGQAVGASVLTGSAAAKPKATASPSPSASSSPSPSASTSPSSTTSGKPGPATTADGIGDASKLNAQTVKDFDRLNCADKNWQVQLYGRNPDFWARPNQQAVGCQKVVLTTGDSVWYKYAMSPAIIQGSDLSSVSAETDPSGAAGYVVAFNVKSPADSKLGTLTTQMQTLWAQEASNPDDGTLGTLAVVLDGQIQSTPSVDSAFSSSGEIEGPSGTGFTQAQADGLANILKYGSLPLSFQTLDSSAVSPQLGSAQLSAGLIAGLIGLILVVIYSFIYYRGLAVVSVSSLAIAAAITYLAVVLLSRYESFNLTLAGVAGLIVAIGITADSFVVYFERLRDEVREGRSLRAAVERGWTRARRTILVSDTVSFLAALLLYIFAIGDVRPFAFTLGLSTLVDIVVVFLFTKPMVTLLARTKFYGRGHKLSGLDPERLGMRSPWRGSRAPAAPAGGASAGTGPATPKEA
jgi:preprotein translocase subunit SecD